MRKERGREGGGGEERETERGEKERERGEERQSEGGRKKKGEGERWRRRVSLEGLFVTREPHSLAYYHEHVHAQTASLLSDCWLIKR